MDWTRADAHDGDVVSNEVVLFARPDGCLVSSGKILVEHYRLIIVEQNRSNLETVLIGKKTSSREMNDLIKIDGLVGENDGWKMLGNAADGSQSWSYYTFEPKEKLDKGESFPDGRGTGIATVYILSTLVVCFSRTS